MASARRIAVIGVGYWGRNLVRNFSALGVLAAVCETAETPREMVRKEYPGVTVHDTPEAVFADSSIDGVVIATPAETHGELTRRALAAGKHVFVEKPLCLDVSDAESLKHLADKKRLILMVGHLLHYHPAFRALHDTAKNGELGELRYIYSNRLSLGKIRREENALWSFAPHDISMILQLAGGMPRRVIASGANYLTAGVADTTLSHLVFGGNLQAHIYVSWLHPFKEQKLVVVGEQGMIVFDDTKDAAEKLLLYRHKVGWDGELPIVSKALPEAIALVTSEPLRNECQAFLDAIDGVSEPPSDAAEGIRVLKVLEACQQSILQGTAIDLES